MSDKPKYRVLIVDDQEAAYIYTNDMLLASKYSDFAVTWYNNLQDAEHDIFTDKYDICLLDYFLGEGEMSGLEFLQKMQHEGCRIPFILLTAHGSQQIDMDALEAGAVEYLDKSSIKPDLLDRAIRYAVKQQRDKNELTDLYSQVRELEQLKTDMIRIAAHDLRTPLMTMLNYAKFLIDDNEAPLPNHQQGYVEEIVKGVRQMQRIISDILSLERIAATAAERYEQTGDLINLTRLAIVDNLPKDRNLTYEYNIPDGEILFTGDPSQIREAIANLLSNAVKYTPEGGKITVEIHIEENGAVLSVTDSGYGIPEDMQERLFQPFYRAKSRQTRAIAGTGLGLHLVKNIITRHEGRVFFHSVYGEGSTFGFYLPIQTKN